MGIRLQERDGRVGRHLYRARILTTRQLADLEFGGKVDAARRRLYVLNGEVVRSLGFGVEPGMGERVKQQGRNFRIGMHFRSLPLDKLRVRCYP